MKLEPHARLGPYEILSPAGAGGMGEVWKARDTRLDRTVAIKVLPEHLSQDPERRQRFHQEAKAISSLNHPHICALYDVGREGELDFLVMEYVEGVTLAERLEKGALPLEEALRCAAHIAEALARAHRAGVVHRDLKPGNIMLTRAGPKLLDFGLAKLRKGTPSEPASLLPTVARPLTQEGRVLGTLPYMAPEQLEGREADERTDLFAFGAVLYEMVTGKRAFDLRTERPPLHPKKLDRIVARCLKSEPDERWQSADDLAWEIRTLAAGESVPAVPAPRPWRERLLWLAAVAALALALGLALGNREALERRPLRFAVSRPEGSTLRSDFIPVLSPDGRNLAFSANDSSGVPWLWVRPLDSLEARPLPGTEGAFRVFWSPDNRSLAYLAERGSLFRVDVDGGPPQELCATAGLAIGGSWGRNGDILLAVGFRLLRVHESGGECVEIPHFDNFSAGVAWPSFLPDGVHYLFTVTASQAEVEGGIYLGSLGSLERSHFFSDETNAVFAPGAGDRILFVREGTLVAAPFDHDRLEVTGNPEPVLGPVDTHHYRWASFSASLEGSLAYEPAPQSSARLTWYDRSGAPLGELDAPEGAEDPELSPDGGKLVVVVPDSRKRLQDLWLIDLGSGAPSRLTFDSADEDDGIWSPDGARIAFGSNRTGYRGGLYEIALAGRSGEKVLLETPGIRWPITWHPDGSAIAVLEVGDRGLDISLLLLASSGGAGRVVPLLHGPGMEQDLQFSPDGRYVSYESDDSGRSEIYIEPFPLTGARWQVSTKGGFSARWRGDGREIFFLTPDRRLMAASIRLEPSFSVETKELFRTRIAGSLGAGVRFNYDVTRDGERFLIVTETEEDFGDDMVVVVNWDAEPGT